jgi:hypothetical protein
MLLGTSSDWFVIASVIGGAVAMILWVKVWDWFGDERKS